MRDILVTMVILSMVPAIFWRPHVGALMWAWVGMMSPHRHTFGFAFSFPFAQIIAICTLITLPFSKERKPFPWGPIPVLIILLMFWMSVTSLYAINDAATVEFHWSKAMKIHGMVLVTLMLIRGRKQIDQLIWVIVVSIGFYGVKGGIWTVLTGSRGQVWGPPRTYIEGNNELALALVMLIPLMYYLHQTSDKKWVRNLLVFSMFACGFSILGSHSRGALLAVVGAGMFLALKSRRPFLMGFLIPVILGSMILFMPSNWDERMGTIATYEQDSSAQGRIYAWETVWNLAKDRPIVGGGFDLATPDVYQRYAPSPDGPILAPHSIYFQALGEHGFVGLALFVALAAVTWRSARRLSRQCEGKVGYEWVPVLMRMIQVSLLGFYIGGAFLGLLHYDLPYYIAALVVLVGATVKEEERARAEAPAPRRVPVPQA